MVQRRENEREDVGESEVSSTQKSEQVTELHLRSAERHDVTHCSAAMAEQRHEKKLNVTAGVRVPVCTF